MKVYLRAAAVMAVCALAGLAWGAEEAPSAAEVGKMLKARLTLRKDSQKLEDELRTKTASLDAKAWGLMSTIQTLQRPAQSAEELAGLKQQLERQKTDLEQLKSQIAATEAQLAAAEIKDPVKRTAKSKELEAQHEALRTELEKAGAPTRAKIEALQKPVIATDGSFGKGLGTFFKTPGDKFASLKKGKVEWTSMNNTGNITYSKEKAEGAAGRMEGQAAVWISLFLNDSPQKPMPHQASIDGKHALNVSGTSNAWVNAGHFSIAVNVNDKDLQGDEAALTALVKALIDLDGLAAVKPE